MRALLVWLLVASCDPALNMSSPQTRRTIDSCPDATDHLRKCCPEFGSYLSCTVLEGWTGQRSADLSAKQSLCLLAADCSAIEKGVVSGKGICDLAFRSNHCKNAHP
jgi:hypothetical protein